MDKRAIVEVLGKERRVEQIASRITHRSGFLYEELCQRTYEALLMTRDDLIADLWSKGEINYYIVRIVKNQWCSSSSGLYREIRDYEKRAAELGTER